MKKIFQLKTALIVLFLILGITLNAQDKEAKDKLADLKGKVEKVTIKVDGKDVVFEGKEAERIAALAKATGEAKLVHGFKLDESAMSGAKKHVRIFKNGGDKQFTVISSDDLDMKAGENEKKVKVEIVDGKKNITITTNKDGKEETKTYEGEEAEKFLKEDGGDGNVKVIVKKLGDDDECDSEGTDHMIFFDEKTYGGGCSCCCKNSCNSKGKSHMKMMHGGKGKMMWKMMDDDSDGKEVHVIVEKKVDKKKELKETKETKKEEKK